MFKNLFKERHRVRYRYVEIKWTTSQRKQSNQVNLDCHILVVLPTIKKNPK